MKGDVTSLSDGSHPKALIFGKFTEINFPDWQIDTQGIDPVYWSWEGPPRWMYDDMNNNEYSMSDDPTLFKGYKASLDFRSCIFPIADIPTDGPSIDASAFMTKAIKCVSWEFKATYKDDRTIIVK